MIAQGQSRSDWFFRLAEVVFFVGLLAVGLLVYRDYGLSWDEPIQRDSVGMASYNWVRHGDLNPLRRSPDRLYGPAFELFLIGVEKVFGLHDSRDVYLARHLVNFLVFFLAVFVFYRLLRQRVDRWSALAGAGLLVFSPRIFADSFYNSKDLIFLSFYIFSLATLEAFLRKPRARTAFFHALVCAWLIDVRILGVVIPGITVVLFGIEAILDRWNARPGRVLKRPVQWFLGLLAVFVIVFWPYLWHNPLLFVSSFIYMSHHPWNHEVLYLGELVKATKLPWHYAPVWVVVTTPTAYLVLIAAGVLGVLVRFARRPVEYLREQPLDVAVLLAWMGPLSAVLGLHAVLYDGWRHLFFLYPPLLYFGVLAFAALWRAASTWPGWFRLAPGLALASVFVCVGWTGWAMVRDHPYQNVYFNRLAGRDLQEIKKRFELDYWGVSCRRGLEYLVEHDSEAVIPVYGSTDPVRQSARLLPAEQRERLRFTDRPEQARYLISHYRTFHGEYPPDREVYAVKVHGGKILVVQRLR